MPMVGPYAAVDVFAPTNAAGALRSVNNSEAQSWAMMMENAVAYGSVTRNTEALLNTVTPTSGTYPLGIVLRDSTATKNGFYAWDGVDTWTLYRGFPDSVARLTNVAGTANAITADTLPGVNPADVQIYIFVPGAANASGGTTIAINGGAAEEILTNAGAELGAGHLVNGVGTILYRGSSGDLRQLFPSDAAAAASATAAAASAAAAAASASSVAASTVATRTALKALDTSNVKTAYLYEAGRAGNFAFIGGNFAARVSEDASTEGIFIAADDTASTSGAWVRQEYLDHGTVNIAWFGAVDGGASGTSKTALDGCADVCAVIGVREVVCNIAIDGTGANKDARNLVLTGSGSVAGLVRGQVYPRLTPPAVPLAGTLVPALHLRTLLENSPRRAVIAGDSTGVNPINNGNFTDVVSYHLQRVLQALFADAPFGFTRLMSGGMRWTDYNEAVTTEVDDWIDVSTTTATWSTSGTTMVVADATGIEVGDVIYSASGISYPYTHVTIVAGTTITFDTAATGAGSGQTVKFRKPWLTIVKELLPHVVFHIFADNDARFMAETTLGNFNRDFFFQVWGKMASWPLKPDPIIFTNYLLSLESSNADIYPAGAQEGVDMMNGFLRTFSNACGFGLIDVNRHANMVRDGRDILNVHHKLAVDEEAFDTPYTHTKEVREYTANLAFTNISADFWDPNSDDSSLWKFRVSRYTYNSIRLQDVGGFLKVIYYQDNGKVWFEQLTSVAAVAATGDVTFSVRCTHDHFFLAVNDVTVFDDDLIKYGGVFAPTFGYSGGEDGPSGTLTLFEGVDQLVKPIAVNSELFAVTGSGLGGDSDGHMNARGMDLHFPPVINQQRWREPVPRYEIGDHAVASLGGIAGVCIDLQERAFALGDGLGNITIGDPDDIIDNATVTYATDSASGLTTGYQVAAGQAPRIELSALPFYDTDNPTGTLIVEGYALTSATAATYACIGPDTDNGHRIAITSNTGNRFSFFAQDDGGSTILTQNVANLYSNRRLVRLGLSFYDDYMLMMVNGVEFYSDFSGIIPQDPTRLKIAHQVAAGATCSVLIRKILLTAEPLTGAELIPRTLWFR